MCWACHLVELRRLMEGEARIEGLFNYVKKVCGGGNPTVANRM